MLRQIHHQLCSMVSIICPISTPKCRFLVMPTLCSPLVGSLSGHAGSSRRSWGGHRMPFAASAHLSGLLLLTNEETLLWAYVSLPRRGNHSFPDGNMGHGPLFWLQVRWGYSSFFMAVVCVCMDFLEYALVWGNVVNVAVIAISGISCLLSFS